MAGVKLNRTSNMVTSTKNLIIDRAFALRGVSPHATPLPVSTANTIAGTQLSLPFNGIPTAVTVFPFFDEGYIRVVDATAVPVSYLVLIVVRTRNGVPAMMHVCGV